MMQLLSGSPLVAFALFVGMCTGLGASPLDMGLWPPTRNGCRNPMGNKRVHAYVLAAPKEWIQQHNADPERTNLKSNMRLLDVQSSLTVER